MLAKVEGASNWWIGDWLNYGENKYGEVKKKVEEIGINYKSARNLKWITNKVELSRRHDSLSFNHHDVVAPLDPKQQNYWLDKF